MNKATLARLVVPVLGFVVAAIGVGLPSGSSRSDDAPTAQGGSIAFKTFGSSNKASNTKPVFRAGEKVINGRPANARDWPGIASLRLYNPETGGSVHFCGGTAISETWVLTAAHCVYDMDAIRENLLISGAKDKYKLQVVLNKSDHLSITPDDVFDINEPSTRIPATYDNDVKEARSRRDDEMEAYARGDIALLNLGRTYHGPVSSIAANDAPETLEAASEILIAGFGATHPSGRDLRTYSRANNETFRVSTAQLTEAPLKLVSESDCRAALPKANISDAQLCAGDLPGANQKDSCNGDSGGPLVAITKEERRVIQIGVVSFGPTPCARASKPIGVYSRVSAYLPWIIEIIGSNS